MSKFVDFVNGALGESRIKQVERTQEKENQKLEKEIKKARKKFEIEILEKYKAHRVALCKYKKKLETMESELLKRKEELASYADELNTKRDELSEWERTIKEKSDEHEKIAKQAIKKYADKKKKEIAVEAARETDKAKSDLIALKEYKEALHLTEFTIIDWLKRVDKKERTVFDEIRKDIEECRQANQSPPEDGFDFERKFAEVLKMNGFENVTVTEESGDFGADVVAEKDGIKYVIQCKYYSSSVGVKAVQQVFASKLHYSAHVAVVATNGVFTKSAKVLAEETGVILWNGLKVQEMINIKHP